MPREGGGDMAQSLCCGLKRKGWEADGRQVGKSTGLHSSNNRIGSGCLVSRCLAPGPGVIERGGLVHESSGKDVVGSVCFGLVGWLMKEMLVSKPSAFSGHEPTLGQTVPPGLVRPLKCQSIIKTEN